MRVKGAAEPLRNRCVFERSRASALKSPNTFGFKSPTTWVLWEVCEADSRPSMFDVRGWAEDYGWSYSDGQAGGWVCSALPFRSYRIQYCLHLWLRVLLTFFDDLIETVSQWQPWLDYAACLWLQQKRITLTYLLEVWVQSRLISWCLILRLRTQS